MRIWDPRFVVVHNLHDIDVLGFEGGVSGIDLMDAAGDDPRLILRRDLVPARAIVKGEKGVGESVLVGRLCCDGDPRE